MIEDLWRVIHRLEEQLLALRKQVQEQEAARDEDLFEIRLATTRQAEKLDAVNTVALEAIEDLWRAIHRLQEVHPWAKERQ